jgi:peptidoglycan hydrolase-like protein with peptidoglycan-binding domain
MRKIINSIEIREQKQGNPTLRIRSRGPSVTQVQQILGITQTGVYDNATRQAVINFQKNNNLTADGTVGPNTWGALSTSKSATQASATQQPVRAPATQQPAQEKEIDRIVKSGPGFIDVGTIDGDIQRRQGNVSWRMNNPGNLRDYPWTKKQPGYVGSANAGASGTFAVFATPEDGFNAKKQLLFSPSSKYLNMTINDAITKYAPETENKTLVYIDAVVKATNASQNTPLNRLTPQQQNLMLDAINRMEGYKVGSITTIQKSTGTA